MCGLEITYEGDQVLSIKGDKDDPFSHGHICPKAMGLKDIYEDENRLKMPVRRTDNGWEEIGWEEAFDEVSARLSEVQGKYGNDSVAFYAGNPNVHNYGTLTFMPAFIKSLKTKNRYSATSVDQLPHHFAALNMFGHGMLMPIPDIDRTDFFLIMGGNPLVSNGSIMTVPGVKKRMQDIQKRGGKVVVVDPRKTETAAIADQHLFVKPGTDVYLLLAMINLVFEKNKVALGRLTDFTTADKELRDLVKPYTPEAVAPVTGIAADEIRSLVDAFCNAKSAVAYGRLGVSVQEFGGVCHWLINSLNILTGNLDNPGGAMFVTPAVDILKTSAGSSKSKSEEGYKPRWSSRVRQIPEFMGELPVSVLAEEILTEGEGQVKAMVTSAGNPVLSTPNGQQLEKAFEDLEYMVSIDIYINETTRHANIILPPATGLEVDHYDLIFHMFAVRNTTKFSSALFEPKQGAKYDWEIFKALTKRMYSKPKKKSLASKAVGAVFPTETPEQILDMGLKFGPYGKLKGKFLSSEGLSLKKLKQSPHGIDLGPLESVFPDRLFTASKKIQMVPPVFLTDQERLAKRFEALRDEQKPNGFALIGRRNLRTNNSWMHNSPRLVKNNPCTLYMHATDADKLGIEEKQSVKVTSRVGSVEIPVEITEDIMPGVVSIPHGWGHGRKGVKLDVATQSPGVSVNDLTDDQYIDKLTGNAALNGVPVEITPVG